MIQLTILHLLVICLWLFIAPSTRPQFLWIELGDDPVRPHHLTTHLSSHVRRPSPSILIQYLLRIIREPARLLNLRGAVWGFGCGESLGMGWRDRPPPDFWIVGGRGGW